MQKMLCKFFLALSLASIGLANISLTSACANDDETPTNQLWADDPPTYELSTTGQPLYPNDNEGNTYLDPSSGNVYIPIAPNVVLDTQTGVATPVQ